MEKERTQKTLIYSVGANVIAKTLVCLHQPNRYYFNKPKNKQNWAKYYLHMHAFGINKTKNQKNNFKIQDSCSLCGEKKSRTQKKVRSRSECGYELLGMDLSFAWLLGSEMFLILLYFETYTYHK